MKIERIAAMVALGGLCCSGCGPREEELRSAVVQRGDVRMAVPFRGELGARRVEMIAVGVQGSAVVEELVAEGTAVEPGDLLARFDSSQIEQDLARLENEWVRAGQELESLEKAELPLEVIEMESKRTAARAELAAEEAFLETARGLAGRGLMSETEVEQQERKAEALRERAKQSETRIELTREHVHAARLAKARSALESAARQRDFALRQLEQCEVRAKVAGIATHVPTTVGGEYRTVQVGDTLYRNQAFLCLPDPTEHVVRGFAEESELPWIRPGNAVEAVPAAFPGAKLTGKVETVGGMAQTRPGQPAWRKYFPVQIALDPLGEPMPTGLSVDAEIAAAESYGTLTVPREAIEWDGSRAHARKRRGDGGWERVEVECGIADAARVEILTGLAEGDEVLLP